MARTRAERPWFVVAGGGTGGHLYPGLAVAEAVRKLHPDFEVTVFGTQRPIDQRLCKTHEYDLVRQTVRPFPSDAFAWFGFLRAWRASIKDATARFNQRRPAMVLGLGGYAAGPPVVVAANMGLPVAIFNPDAFPGRANKKLSRMVDCVFVQWSETVEQFPKARAVKVTGCPIRPEFKTATRKNGCRALKLDEERPTLLITGASQGARSINYAAIQLMDLWKAMPEWQLVHLTGDTDLEMCKAAYKEAGVSVRTLSYTDHMALCMAAADLVVSRAGASTLAEITARGLPSVLMPYPYDRKQHQMANAKILADHHAAEIVVDGGETADSRQSAKQAKGVPRRRRGVPDDTAKRLGDALAHLMKSEHRRQRMVTASAALGQFDAANKIAGELVEMWAEV